MKNLLEQLEQLQTQKKAIDAQIDGIKAQLTANLTDSTTLKHGCFSVKISKVSSHRVDYKKICEVLKPSTYLLKKYSSDSQYFRINQVKREA